MNIDMMRDEIKKSYPHKKWATHVDDMPDNQVLAVYLRFKRAGKLLIKDAAPQEPNVQKAVKYKCNVCNIMYLRDNPDLEECEVCGSKSFEVTYSYKFEEGIEWEK